MKKNDIWFLVLAVFFMLDVISSWNMWINICTILCAVALLAESVIRLARVIKSRRKV